MTNVKRDLLISFITLVLFFAFFLIQRWKKLKKEIIECRRLENELIKTQERLKFIVNTGPAVIYCSKPSGNTTFISENVKSQLGYEVCEYLEDSSFWVNHIHPEDTPRVFADLTQVFTQGYYVCEYRFLHKNGTYRWLHDELNLVSGKDGKPIEIIGARIDITRRKLAEGNLKHYTAELKRSNQDLRDFAFIASHDLQEPLRKILAFSDRLKTTNLDDRGKDYIDRMQKAAKRMQRYIEDLLQFSRITTMAQPFEQTNLETVIHEVIEDLETRIAETGAIVEIGNLPVVLDTNKTQMHQLFQNLIANSLKFHKDGVAPVIKINSRPLDDKIWEITVEDNGIGFDEKYLERIFKPFQRLHGRSNFEGSGMGLAICERIVICHYGKITARSASGKGATFIISLPSKYSSKGENISEKETISI